MVVSNEDSASVISDQVPFELPEGSSNGHSTSVGTDSLAPDAPSATNSEDSTSVATHPLLVVKPESSSNSDSSSVVTGARASRDGKSTNSFRHLTLLAKEESRLVFATEPNGLAAEQFRLLRRTLYKEFESGAVLLVTSPAMGDGKTLTSLNLAACLAESIQPTLLVEADIRRPAIRQVVSDRIEPPGVEDVLARKVEPQRVVHGIKELNLYAVMCAKVPDDPAHLLGGPGVKSLLTWARENFLWVVLDAPPVLPTADVSELLPFADAALLVVRAQNTPRELVKQAIEILGKHLRGVIFNEVTVDSNPHYRYMNNYYYPQKSNLRSGLIRSAKRSKPA